MPFTTLLIDDEPAAHYALKELLKKHVDTIQVVGDAFSGKEAISLCEIVRPELLFLDIKMPDMNGFEVLEQLSFQPFVIFSTAYDQYAIQAFNENSIDYLLKPIEEKRFEHCIQKLKRLHQKPSTINYTELNHLFEQFQKSQKKTGAIPIHTQSKIMLVRCTDIIFCKAAGGYVSLFTNNGKEYISDLSLGQLEERLPESFLRVQKSYIVNKDRIEEIHKYFNNRLILVMADKPHTHITTGTSYITTIRKALDL